MGSRLISARPLENAIDAETEYVFRTRSQSAPRAPKSLVQLSTIASNSSTKHNVQSRLYGPRSYTRRGLHTQRYEEGRSCACKEGCRDKNTRAESSRRHAPTSADAGCAADRRRAEELGRAPGKRARKASVGPRRRPSTTPMPTVLRWKKWRSWSRRCPIHLDRAGVDPCVSKKAYRKESRQEGGRRREWGQMALFPK